MAKCSQAEFQIRVETTVKMLMNGKTRHDMIRHGEEFWSVGERQVEEYMSLAWDIIRETGKEGIAKEKARVLKNIWKLFGQAEAEGDRREQHALMNTMSKLLGLEIAPAEQPPRHADVPQEELDRLAQEELH